MTQREWGLLGLLSFLWGGSFFLTEIALREVTPLVTVWARVGLAALFLLIFLRIRGIPLPRTVSLWGGFLMMGFLNNALPFSLIVWGQTELSSALAAILNATTPLFTIVIAQAVTKEESLSVRKVVGLCIGFFGVIIMVGTDALSGLGDHVAAQLAILGAAISYGCAALWGRRFKDVPPIITATGQITCSSLIMTPLALIWGFPDGMSIPSVSTLFALGGLALFCTVIAYALYFKILLTSGATNLMLVTFLVPLSALTLGVLFLGESLSFKQLCGMVCILFALLMINERLKKQFKRS